MGSVNRVYISESKGSGSRKFNVMNLRINHPTKVARHPIEVGAAIMDNKIVDPVEIEGTIILVVSQSDFFSLRSFLNEARDDTTGKTYTVSSKYGVYTGMIFESVDDDETNDRYDAVTINVKLVQRLAVTAKATPLKKENTDNATSGKMNASQTSENYSKSNLKGFLMFG